MTDKQQSGKQHSGLKGAAERAQEVAGSMVGMAAAAVSSADSGRFVADAAIGNLYELESARLALARARSDDVKVLAATLVDDHTTAGHQLRSTLRSMPGAPPCPGDLDDRRAQMIDHLRQTPDDEFDARFLEQQVMAHEENLTLFQGFARNGDDPSLRLFAAASVPSLERHLHAVRQARRH